MALPKERQGGFTYADYLTWSQDERWELIDGVAWSMSPAPSRAHQAIAGRAFRAIGESGMASGSTGLSTAMPSG